MQLVRAARENIILHLEGCNVLYEIIPLDEDLYRGCIDDPMRRGYPVEGDRSVLTFLRRGVVYTANTSPHLPCYPLQVWIALYTSCAIFVDETIDHFPEEMPNIYLFNERFVRKKPQGNSVLEAFADIIRQLTGVRNEIHEDLERCTTLSHLPANLVWPLRDYGVSKSASSERLHSSDPIHALLHQQREICTLTVLRCTRFATRFSDLFSFYKEERVGETTNHVCTQAARTKKSKLVILNELTEATIVLYKGILKILERSTEACEAFKSYTAGYIYFHISSGRYHLEDLGL